ncbi:MAG: YgfZ/GcvT domain-containing protein [Alphaproteobacteria bacterium]
MMTNATEARRCAVLDARGLIAVSGPEARPFLQGLVSNDVHKVTAARAIYAVLLTPQGKFLHDFFVAELDDALVFDCEAARRDDLVRRLEFYRLRARVTIAPRDDLVVVAAFGAGALDALGLAADEGAARPLAGGIVYTDPRLAAAGARAVLPRPQGCAAIETAGFAAAGAEAYDDHRLALALPDGSRDMPVERAFLIENGIDALNGIDFEKGCYIGQELTARTRYRATIRKRLFRVDVDGPLPAPGAPVMLGDKRAGEMRSGRGAVGLAMLRLDLVERATQTDERLTADAACLTPVEPGWARFQSE